MELRFLAAVNSFCLQDMGISRNLACSRNSFVVILSICFLSKIRFLGCLRLRCLFFALDMGRGLWCICCVGSFFFLWGENKKRKKFIYAGKEEGKKEKGNEEEVEGGGRIGI